MILRQSVISAQNVKVQLGIKFAEGDSTLQDLGHDKAQQVAACNLKELTVVLHTQVVAVVRQAAETTS